MQREGYLYSMNEKEALFLRHAVRNYKDQSITKDKILEIEKEIDRLRFKSRLYIRLVTEEGKAFSSLMAKYGRFKGVRNYIVISGKKEDDLMERAGYFGLSLSLFLQKLGLNTCFVAVSFSKKQIVRYVPDGNKLAIVLTVGYGVNEGAAHKSKALSELAAIPSSAPNWYQEGVKGALAAPTAMNQQHFYLEYKDEMVKFTNKGGICSSIDEGIVKYAFEVASGKDSSIWKK